MLLNCGCGEFQTHVEDYPPFPSHRPATSVAGRVLQGTQKGGGSAGRRQASAPVRVVGLVGVGAGRRWVRACCGWPRVWRRGTPAQAAGQVDRW